MSRRVDTTVENVQRVAPPGSTVAGQPSATQREAID